MSQAAPYVVHQGDALDVLPTLAAESVDLAFTSPPYFNARDYATWASYADYLDWLAALLGAVRRVLKPGRPLVLNVSCVIEPRASRAHESHRLPIPFDVVGLAERAGFDFVEDILWVKPDGASARAVKFAHHRRPVAYKPFQVTEYVLVFRRDDGGLIDAVIRDHDAATIEASLVGDRYARTNVWAIAPDADPRHPAPFPLELAARVVAYYSFVGDVVLDPCMGRGTAGWAALALARRFVGIERDAAYFARAQAELEARAAQGRLW